MREDILGGLKNAMDRGVSLEQAIKSYLNAGYNEAEVREAAQALNLGTLPAITASKQPQQPQAKPSTQPPVTPAAPAQPAAQARPAQVIEVKKIPRQPPSFTLIFLVGMLLLSIAGFIFSLMYRKSIAAWLQNALG